MEVELGSHFWVRGWWILDLMRYHFRIFSLKILLNSKEKNDSFIEGPDRHQLFQVIKVSIYQQWTEWQEHTISEGFLPGYPAWMNVKRKITLQNERPVLLKTVRDIWQGKTEALLFQAEGSWKDLTTTGNTCSWIGLGPETKRHNGNSWWNLNGVWTLEGSIELMCISLFGVLYNGYVGKNPLGVGRIHAGELRGYMTTVCS